MNRSRSHHKSRPSPSALKSWLAVLLVALGAFVVVTPAAVVALLVVTLSRPVPKAAPAAPQPHLA